MSMSAGLSFAPAKSVQEGYENRRQKDISRLVYFALSGTDDYHR